LGQNALCRVIQFYLNFLFVLDAMELSLLINYQAQSGALQVSVLRVLPPLID